jgi:hypothetical protein
MRRVRFAPPGSAAKGPKIAAVEHRKAARRPHNNGAARRSPVRVATGGPWTRLSVLHPLALLKRREGEPPEPAMRAEAVHRPARIRARQRTLLPARNRHHGASLMSRRKKQKTIRLGSGLVPLGGADDKADYQARVKAAGLDATDAEIDAMDIDTFRLDLARRIAMFINEWPGCPEAICQRMRGCMAPDIHCTNVPRRSEEESAALWPQTLVTIRRALDKAIARRKAAGVWPDD